VPEPLFQQSEVLIPRLPLYTCFLAAVVPNFAWLFAGLLIQRPKWGCVAGRHPATLEIYQSILCKRLLRIVSCLPRFPPIPDSPERRRPSFPLPLPVPLAAENPHPWGPLASIAPPTRYRTLFAVKPKDGFALRPLNLPSASPIHRRSIVPWDGTRVGGDPTPGGWERTAPSRFPRPAMGRGGPRVAGPRGSLGPAGPDRPPSNSLLPLPLHYSAPAFSSNSELQSPPSLPPFRSLPGISPIPQVPVFSPSRRHRRVRADPLCRLRLQPTASQTATSDDTLPCPYFTILFLFSSIPFSATLLSRFEAFCARGFGVSQGCST